MVKYFRFLLISLLFVPFIVNAKYVQVNDLNDIKENSKIFFLVDDNVFTFVDILENPTNTEVSIDEGINENEIDYNNIFNVGKIINISGNFKLHDHSEYKFISKEELNNYDYCPADKALVEFLISME